MDYFSARLLFIILVADGPGRKRNDYDESVIVFRAKDHVHAFKRALQLGRAQETDYLNDKGQKVRWALVEIQNLERIGPDLDGKEVSSRLHSRVSKKRISPQFKFTPERSNPISTLA